MEEYNWIDPKDRLPELRDTREVDDTIDYRTYERISDIVLICVKTYGEPKFQIARYVKHSNYGYGWQAGEYGFRWSLDGDVTKWLPIPRIEEEPVEE